MAEDGNQPPAVDETPISPLERQDSIEKALKIHTEEHAQDLKNRNILWDTKAAPALQSKQRELERQQAADSLRKGLEHRPQKDELVERNILSSSTAAPALQSQQKDLERHMRKDSLEKQLQARPKPEDLIKEGILQADEKPVQD